MIPSRLALVTGANKGLGHETARQLARLGIAVLLGSRDLDRAAAAVHDLATDGVLVSPVQVDVTDPVSVARLAQDVERDHGRLDILINNAGTFVAAAATATTATEMRQIFEVNVFGVVTTIHALLPLLRRSPAPRIVNVSSTTGSLTLTSEGVDIPGDATRRLAYTASKAALNMLTVQYALAFRGDPDMRHIKINSASPGYTATAMNQHCGTRQVADGARIVVDLATLAENGPTGGFFSDEGPLPW
ncbi:MAG: SDR family oxidoreductase [Acidimicrobiales bacterium]